jgi:hypothetical protein
MTPPKRPSRKPPSPRLPTEENGVVQLKVWLLGISPMVWRRLLVPSTCTLRELHGVIQVAMGWEGIHLYLWRRAKMNGPTRNHRPFPTHII